MTDLHLTNFDVHRDHRGILTAILNVPDQPVNVFSDGVLHDLGELLLAVEHDETVKALVFRSGKESGFLAGADLHLIERLHTEADAREACYSGQEVFERLQDLAIPTLAVISGVCLGGGLEFVMACRHRIAIDDPRTKLGLPEVELGLIPGWGGTQRLPQCVGLSAALPMLLTGRKIGGREALQIGLVDAVAQRETVEGEILRLLDIRDDRDLLERYRVDATFNISAAFFRLFDPEAKPRRPRGWLNWLKDRTRLGQWLVMWLARRRIAPNVEHYPALASILNAVDAGLKDRRCQRERFARAASWMPRVTQQSAPPGPMLNGYGVERDEFGKLLITGTHHSLLGLFFQREQARKAGTWISGPKTRPHRLQKIGVIGGGVMGAGIAHAAVSQGFDVVLKEVNADLLNAGLSRIEGLFQESVRRGSMTEAQSANKLGAIVATTDWMAFADVDLVIEAVTERLDIKREVFRDLERHCSPSAVLVSNTSALSIRDIAMPLHEPARVLGLHFFNPVPRMPLVEIVRTDHSRDQDVVLLIDFVKQLGKVPVVTGDSPGFVVNRILFPYLDEAVRLHCDGVPTVEIDRSLKRFGMPMGPLELLDQVGLDVAAHVANSLSGLSPQPSPTTERLREMVAQGWLGKKSDAGFYKYAKGKKGRPLTLALSPQSRGEGTKPIGRRFPDTARATTAGHLFTRTGGVTLDDIRDRVVLRLVNEAAKCLHEGVVSEPWMIDLAMVLGTGFAPFTGGPLRMCELQGYGEVVEKLEYFEKTLGPRFAPATWLIEQIEHPHEHHARPDWA